PQQGPRQLLRIRPATDEPGRQLYAQRLMHGNVWEWCSDRYDQAYPAGPVTDPVGPEEGSDRVIRGGSWNSPAEYCRAAYRLWIRPAGGGHDLGFRVVRVPG